MHNVVFFCEDLEVILGALTIRSVGIVVVYYNYYKEPKEERVLVIIPAWLLFRCRIACFQVPPRVLQAFPKTSQLPRVEAVGRDNVSLFVFTALSPVEVGLGNSGKAESKYEYFWHVKHGRSPLQLLWVTLWAPKYTIGSTKERPTVETIVPVVR